MRKESGWNGIVAALILTVIVISIAYFQENNAGKQIPKLSQSGAYVATQASQQNVQEPTLTLLRESEESQGDEDEAAQIVTQRKTQPDLASPEETIPLTTSEGGVKRKLIYNTDASGIKNVQPAKELPIAG